MAGGRTARDKKTDKRSEPVPHSKLPAIKEEKSRREALTRQQEEREAISHRQTKIREEQPAIAQQPPEGGGGGGGGGVREAEAEREEYADPEGEMEEDNPGEKRRDGTNPQTL